MEDGAGTEGLYQQWLATADQLHVLIPLMWKLLTGIFVKMLSAHLQGNTLFLDEQKGCTCRRRSWGTQAPFLIDKVVLREGQVRKRCLVMGWKDYQKAYDMHGI